MQQKSNLVSIVSYPLVWLLYPIVVWYPARFLVGVITNRFFIPSWLGYIILFFNFLIPSVISGLLAKIKPARMAILGAFFHHILLIIFAPLIVNLVFSFGKLPHDLAERLALDPSNPLFTTTFRLLVIIFFPIVALISLVGGYIGGRLRKRYFTHGPYAPF